MFQKATKKKSKLRLTLDGPAGSGKTYSALELATAMGSRIALIDSEHGSASKYADRFHFDTCDLPDHQPLTYVKHIKAAGEAGYDVLIIDSLSHAWVGALEIVDREKDKFGSGWRKVTPMHNQLVEAILSFPGHVICTMRSKMAYESEKDSNGKTVIRKLGMAPIQREGMEYEFDVVVDLTHEGNVNVSKTRCSALKDKPFSHSTVRNMGAILKEWLEDGAPVEKAVSFADAKKALSDNGITDAPASIPMIIEEVNAASDIATLTGIWNSLTGVEKVNETVLQTVKLKKEQLLGKGT
jgi:hypothetical protein